MEYIQAPNWGKRYADAKLKQYKRSRIRWEIYDKLISDMILILTVCLCIQLICKWFQ